jgi:nitroreductase
VAVTLLPLSPDELLSTTRAVRKRLDFDKPLDDDLIRECIAMAQQAPAGSNVATAQFVVVRDAAKRAAVGEIYRQCFDIYRNSPMYAGGIDQGSEAGNRQQARVTSSADYLGENMGEAPALIIACNSPRLDRMEGMAVPSLMANVLPATWSFMLAARARGLGTAWTTVHLMMEQQTADLLGIPFDEVQQVMLSPIAFTTGTDFKPAMRPDPDTVIHWDTW